LEPVTDATEGRIRDALREVIDPELGVNIVDLGLVYAIESDDQAVHVRMTMTTPSCPMGSMLAEEARAVVSRRFTNHRVDVDLVWDPPWRADMMSQLARIELGLQPDGNVV
jgi:metal-sulfur cluster biosynthetic enzyme